MIAAMAVVGDKFQKDVKGFKLRAYGQIRIEGFE
jgi:hypothetical protein